MCVRACVCVCVCVCVCLCARARVCVCVHYTEMTLTSSVNVGTLADGAKVTVTLHNPPLPARDISLVGTTVSTLSWYSRSGVEGRMLMVNRTSTGLWLTSLTVFVPFWPARSAPKFTVL